MDLQALKEEVENDPTGKGYAAQLPDSPGLVVEMLNAKTEQAVGPLKASTAMSWSASGPYAQIVDVANTQGHAARASCLVVKEALRSGSDFHLEDAAVRSMFDAWVSAGVITQDQHDALIVAATQPASRAEVLGFGAVTEQDLIKAGVV